MPTGQNVAAEVRYQLAYCGGELLFLRLRGMLQQIDGRDFYVIERLTILNGSIVATEIVAVLANERQALPGDILTTLNFIRAGGRLGLEHNLEVRET